MRDDWYAKSQEKPVAMLIRGAALDVIVIFPLLLWGQIIVI